MASELVVVGSLNMDLVVQLERHPIPGETLLALGMETHPGGKGANQAVAAARMGGRVSMVGRVGNDGYGQVLLDGLAREGIILEVGRSPAPTGIALIPVDRQGQNTVLVVPGANATLQPADVEKLDWTGCKVLICQLEIPLETVAQAARLARQVGAVTLLNAAPAQPLNPNFLALFDLLVVNETEAGLLLNQPAANPDSAAAMALQLSQWVPQVIITLGGNGAAWHTPKGPGHQEAFRVKAVDTTAAGDAFVGALAVGLAEGLTLPQAARLGMACGALAVTQAGAQPSLPRRNEVEALLIAG